MSSLLCCVQNSTFSLKKYAFDSNRRSLSITHVRRRRVKPTTRTKKSQSSLASNVISRKSRHPRSPKFRRICGLANGAVERPLELCFLTRGSSKFRGVIGGESCFLFLS